VILEMGRGGRVAAKIAVARFPFFLLFLGMGRGGRVAAKSAVAFFSSSFLILEM